MGWERKERREIQGRKSGGLGDILMQEKTTKDLTLKKSMRDGCDSLKFSMSQYKTVGRREKKLIMILAIFNSAIVITHEMVCPS